MGWGAPARLALCVVRSRARGAGAGRARRHRDRESPATAREGLPVQSGAGAGARYASRPELRAGEHRSGEHRAHAAHPAATRGRAAGGAARRGVDGGPERRRAARTRPRGARGRRSRFIGGGVPSLPERRRRLRARPAGARADLLLRAAAGGGVAHLFRRGAPGPLRRGPGAVPRRLECPRGPRRDGAVRRLHVPRPARRVARDDVQDYKLVESLADAVVAGFRGALALQGRRGLDPITSDLFASRADVNPLYARLGNTLGSANAAGALAVERSLGQHSIAVGTTTDSYRRVFVTPLEVLTSEFVVGARAPQGGQQLHVVFAIPGHQLTPVADSMRVLYPISFRLVVCDTLDDQVARLDTTRVFTAPQALPSGAYLTGQLALPVPPGRYRYRLP